MQASQRLDNRETGWIFNQTSRGSESQRKMEYLTGGQSIAQIFTSMSLMGTQ